MKKFFINIFLFITIFFILNRVPDLFLNPYYGNKYYLEKHNYFTNNQDKFNAVIFGSSRLYRHLNPRLLDRLLTDHQISTFNLAAPGTSNPEAYYLYQKLLETVETNRLKHAFVELQLLKNIGLKNLHTTRNYYWYNWKYFCYSVNYILASNLPLRKKKILITRYFISYVNKIINRDGYKERLFKKLNKDGLYIGKNNDGFYSLNAEMRNSGDKKMRRRLASVLKNKAILKKRLSIAYKAFSAKQNERFLNKVHLRMLIELIEKSKQKGVHLVFIIPPGLKDYNQLLAIKEKLPDNHIIEIANPEKYPELYQVKFSFDGGHLNAKGANVFTKYIANELIKNVFSINSEGEIPWEKKPIQHTQKSRNTIQ